MNKTLWIYGFHGSKYEDLNTGLYQPVLRRERERGGGDGSEKTYHYVFPQNEGRSATYVALHHTVLLKKQAMFKFYDARYFPQLA
jgi:hypothetical protein